MVFISYYGKKHEKTLIFYAYDLDNAKSICNDLWGEDYNCEVLKSNIDSSPRVYINNSFNNSNISGSIDFSSDITKK